MDERRIGFLDFLRGFSLLGILIVNLPYFAKPMYLVGAKEENSQILDFVATWIVAGFFEFKFYLLFSFLFGFAFFLQMQTGSNASYFRRIFALLAIGILHGIFLFLGDILFSYGVLGILLWFVRNRDARWLLQFSFFCLVLALVFRSLFLFWGDEYKAQYLADLPRLIEESRKAYLGGFWESSLQRAKETYLSLPILILYQWPSALAMFALGLAAAKSEVFSDLQKTKELLSKYFIPLFLLGILGNVIYTADSRHLLPEDWNKLVKFLLLISEVFGAPALSFCYVFLLLVYYKNTISVADRPWFETMGRLSLSNYLGESLVCAWVFCGWGLGKFDSVGNYILLLLGPAIWIGLSALTLAWSRYYSYGPAEWLLRSWTHWKRILS